MKDVPIKFREAVRLLGQDYLVGLVLKAGPDFQGELTTFKTGAKLIRVKPAGKRCSYVVRGYAADGSDINNLGLGVKVAS